MKLSDRLSNAIKAFRGLPIKHSIEFGVDVKRCNRCEYKNNQPIRDDLLVTAGARAAYMEDANIIELPHGVEGEARLAEFVSKMVDRYLTHSEFRDVPCDEYIELALKAAYGVKEEV